MLSMTAHYVCTEHITFSLSGTSTTPVSVNSLLRAPVCLALLLPTAASFPCQVAATFSKVPSGSLRMRLGLSLLKF